MLVVQQRLAQPCFSTSPRPCHARPTPARHVQVQALRKPFKSFTQAPKPQSAPPEPPPAPPTPPTPRGPCRAFDHALEQGLQLAPWVPSLPKVAESLAAQRRLAADLLVAQTRPTVDRLAPRIAAGDEEAVRAYDALVDAAVLALRHDKDGSLRDVLVDLDNQTFRRGVEISDDPHTPMGTRLAILDTLHRFNSATRSYERWGDKLLDWLRPGAVPGDAACAPIHIVDLAAGTGGFAVALKQRFGDAVKVTATDLVDAFLTLGQEQARKTQTDVTFAHQDMLDLRTLRDANVDVFTCTQSLHHFTPGQLGRIIGEAHACAKRGLCFIDGERGMLVTALVTLSMALYGRDYPVVHDTFVSMCRMYVAEEMALIARLAPGITPKATIDAGRLPPGHLYLRVDKNEA